MATTPPSTTQPSLVGDATVRAHHGLITAFLLLTTPVASHAIASAVRRGRRAEDDPR